MNNLMEKIVSLCKHRGFIFPGSEIYGGLSNSYDYGPLGVELKNNIKKLWWKKFVHERDDIVGIDAALIMNTEVWEKSGHLKEFSDPLAECKKCHHRFRLDENGNMEQLQKSKIQNCPNCGNGKLAEPKDFNLMFKTYLGPTEDESSLVYLRPEIAQAMFVDFKNVLDTTRKKLPFGIASQGKAFRNEITPGNFIFRTREFDLMEFEYFVRPPKVALRTNAGLTQKNAEKEEWEQWFEYWLKEMKNWLALLGISVKKLTFREIPEDERAHYSKRTVDIEYDYPFGRKELYGLAYRTDFDLKRHFKHPPYKDPETGESFYPHVIEPTFGLDRSVLAVLLDAYNEDGERTILKLNSKLAPFKAAVFPLLANKPELVKLARKIYDGLRKDFNVAFDDRGNIGKRYFSQDEIGTPYCITVDFDSLEKKDVTVRDRDTMKQKRVKIPHLREFLNEKI